MRNVTQHKVALISGRHTPLAHNRCHVEISMLPSRGDNCLIHVSIASRSAVSVMRTKV